MDNKVGWVACVFYNNANPISSRTSYCHHLFFCGMYEDEEHGVIKRVKMWTKIMSISLVVFALGAIFVPTTSDALLIYGVGGTIDYIKSNKTAQKLPDKCIKALDKYLDEQNSKTNEPGK